MGRSALRAYESLTSQECYHERADGRGLFFGQSVNPGNEPKNPAQLSVHIARSVISRHPSRSALRAYETAAASGAMAAVSWRQASRLSAPLGATVSLRSYPRGQAR